MAKTPSRNRRGSPSGLAKRLKSVPWDPRRFPRVCEVTLHFACNARCAFCYQPDDDPAFSERSLSFEEAARALYAGRREGCWIACLIGGEPTLYDGLEKLARLAGRIGYECVKVVTNGLKLADRAYTERLARAGVNCFNISIHGLSPGVHDRLVGVPGALERCLKAIGNVRRLGRAVGVDHVFTRRNYRDFPDYFETMLLRHEVNYYNMIYPNIRGAMARHADELVAPYSEVVPYVRRAMDCYPRAGLPAFSRVLVNFPPCVLPGYEPILADWEAPDGGSEEPLFGPGIGAQDMLAMKEDQRVKPKGCRSCVYHARCAGVEREYFERFGGEELVPLKKVPRRAPVETLFAEKTPSGGKPSRG